MGDPFSVPTWRCNNKSVYTHLECLEEGYTGSKPLRAIYILIASKALRLIGIIKEVNPENMK